MKAIMLSIQPKRCENIANGKQTIVVRKSRPKLETPFKCYIYETQGASRPLTYENGRFIYVGRCAVIGEFVCDRVVEWRYLPDHKNDGEYEYYITPLEGEYTCLTYKEIENYGNGKTLYGWHISDLKIYDKPKELSEFRGKCSFRNKDGSCTFKKVCCDAQSFDYNADGSLNIVKCNQRLTKSFPSWGYVEEVE